MSFTGAIFRGVWMEACEAPLKTEFRSPWPRYPTLAAVGGASLTPIPERGSDGGPGIEGLGLLNGVFTGVSTPPPDDTKRILVCESESLLRKKEGQVVPINEKLRDELTDKLFEAILTLETVDECYRFFEDLATISEIKALAQRLEVAKMLDAGMTYEDIVAATGASTATISRVKKCLNYGADGYRVVLERVKR